MAGECVLMVMLDNAVSEIDNVVDDIGELGIEMMSTDKMSGLELTRRSTGTGECSGDASDGMHYNKKKNKGDLELYVLRLCPLAVGSNLMSH